MVFLITGSICTLQTNLQFSKFIVPSLILILWP